MHNSCDIIQRQRTWLIVRFYVFAALEAVNFITDDQEKQNQKLETIKAFFIESKATNFFLLSLNRKEIQSEAAQTTTKKKSFFYRSFGALKFMLKFVIYLKVFRVFRLFRVLISPWPTSLYHKTTKRQNFKYQNAINRMKWKHKFVCGLVRNSFELFKRTRADHKTDLNFMYSDRIRQISFKLCSTLCVCDFAVMLKAVLLNLLSKTMFEIELLMILDFSLHIIK